MRQLKFRAWNEKKKKYEKPINFAVDGQGKIYFLYMYEKEEPTSDLIIEQFTGLQDKNGEKDIYEGDIFWDENGGIGVVTFCNGCFWFKGKGLFELLLKNDRKKIIGNIHENPELLEGEK